MKPVDPRLARRTRSVRRHLAACGVLAAVGAGLTLAQAVLLATAIARAFTGRSDLAELEGVLAALAAVLVARAGLAGLEDLLGRRAAGRVKAELRAQTLAAVAAGAGQGRPPGEIATLTSTGLDALDGYVGRYLPALTQVAVVPLLVLGGLAVTDLTAAATVAITLPLIPLFLALVGLSTASYTRRQMRLLTRLGGHFADVVRGLPTLKAFRRSRAQVATIAEISNRYRVATLRTLRLAFLSSLVLELVATLSVALVAVGVGLRLVEGHLSLQTALTVLILAPEAYLPLRRLGALHHTSEEGITAAADALDLIDSTPLPGGRQAAPDPASLTLTVRDLTIDHPDRDRPAPVDLTMSVRPGELLAVTGSSGSGKSTLLRVLAALTPAPAGHIEIGGTDLAEIDAEAWRSRVAWVGQQPFLFAGSLADNIRLGRPAATDLEVAQAAELSALGDLLARLPAGLDAEIGEGGAGLSAGERRRVTLARAFLRDAPLLLLDEPTADLDAETERRVAAAIRAQAPERTIVVVTHRPALRDLADRVVDLDHVADVGVVLVDAEVAA
ncbi:thiol reductant ABC exporter subunit CydD [Sporichthya polymorpha]|uniref:thiol reductant ABC exporter subunit CydD n=1 Tax=Sporichthya polymorpha TaxID=35751 RepID=UPI00038133D3|nr:thiol reductant ABC exporter subunit CydD [Sporichthya polymorpha]